ncbi:Bromodomain-containing protein [Calocera cornea HHB12733]|uniref:Bromodomain-containing protein n=1 Tax=Calocera cornea HHB12733 TaxID=1353952 RepID=A0A165K4H2_9BASI|nr:Bromodomain-containing protein [Calocera cornea HHB12733]
MSSSSPVPDQMTDQAVKPRKPRMGIDPANIIDGPRLKKRKESPDPSAGGRTKQRKTSEEKKRGMKQEDADVGTEERVKVAEEGSNVWKAVREEKDSAARLLCYDFLRLPSRRLYPDYYEQIKRPLCMEDVKANLDSLSYSNLEAVRQDLLTIFRNAQRYNVKESQIWQDAKHLKKLINKQFKALNHHSHDDDDDDDEHPTENKTPQVQVEPDVVDEMDIDVEGEGEDGQESQDIEVVGGKTRKRKPPTLQKALKIRLTKLTRKTDEESNRDRCGIFMELPSHKDWPHYYQTIEHPICMTQILEKVSKNEYKSVAQCTADVDLMFNNALSFNEEGSDIAEDAKFLMKAWHDSLKSLPTRFSDQPPLNGDASTKIRIKRPLNGAAGARSPTVDVGSPVKIASPLLASQSAGISHSSPVAVVVRPSEVPSERMASEVASPPTRAPSAPYQALPPVPALARQYSATTPLAAYYSSLYPNAAAHMSPFLSPSLPASQRALSPATVTAAAVASPASSEQNTTVETSVPAPAPVSSVPMAKSPPPPEDPKKRMIKQIDLLVQPTKRRITLKDDITKAYSLILGISEKKMLIDVTFNASSLHYADEEQQTNGDVDAIGEIDEAILPEKFNCAVKLNGVLIEALAVDDMNVKGAAELRQNRPTWTVELSAGMNIVEIGVEPKESHGKPQVWKLFVMKVN